MKNQTTGAIVNSLISRQVRPIYNWAEWLNLWQSAETIQEMLGLLHAGFDVPLGRRERDEKSYDWIDRVLFYFNLADGWVTYDALASVNDSRDERYEFGAREHSQSEKKIGRRPTSALGHQGI